MSTNPGPLTVETCNTEGFVFGPQFSQIQPIGHGSSGLVFSAFDNKRKKKVAIKKLTFNDGQSCQKTLREVKIVRHLKHENIISILDVIGWNGQSFSSETPMDAVDLQQVLLIQELFDTDLHSIIQSQQLQPDHIVFFTYQLLRGLKYVHSVNVIHRDLRPCNILINCNTLLLKLTDFGISRIVDPNYSHKGHLSPNVGSCWYHSPEQLVTPHSYTNAIDMWSVGCVLVEMILGAPLFSATNQLEQLLQIIDAIFLSENDWSQVLRVMPNKMLKNHPFKPRRPLGTRLGNIDSSAVDLAEKLLTFEASERLTAEEALSHLYLWQYHEPADEPVADTPLRLEHEVDNLSPTSLCSMIFDESHLKNQQQPSSSSPPPPLPPPQIDDTHTLSEILSFHDPPPLDDDQSLSSATSYKSSSVEDLNLRNLCQSQESLSSSSYNILTLGEHAKKVDREETDEKEQADLSVRKLEEDKELEMLVASYDKMPVVIDKVEEPPPVPTPVPPPPSPPPSPAQQVKLRVCTEHLQDSTPPRALSPACNRCVYISDDEEFKEKKLLEASGGSSTMAKVKADTLESEKQRARAIPPPRDLDEMYRLPTEHLQDDRDYSNERLKRKHLSKLHVRQLLRYRDEINELNERLRGDGACGGFELDEEHDEELLGDGRSGRRIVLTAAAATPVPSTQPLSIENEQQLLTAQAVTVSDGFSSPEEQPSSPRQPHSGARPKKSPRKQKAL